jgi:hypothetical protein
MRGRSRGNRAVLELRNQDRVNAIDLATHLQRPELKSLLSNLSLGLLDGRLTDVEPGMCSVTEA